VVRPDFLTVEEAARVLRIGRTSAYLAAKRYRDTGGAEGLPVVAIRGSLRVPRRQLEAMAGGPIDANDLAAPVTSVDEQSGSDRPPTATPAATPTPTPKPKRNASNVAQRSLPFSP
jgi:hypothetical protein